MNQPLGASRNASPIAIAEWGVASRGGSPTPRRRARIASAAKASESESAVAGKPTKIVKASPLAKPGSANRERQGARLKSRPPRAGR